MSYELRYCAVCNRPFYIWTGSKYKRHSKKEYPLRNRNSKTCSMDCSKKYIRIKKSCFEYLE